MPRQVEAELPKQLSITRAPVPFSVMTAVTTVDTEVAEISVANTTNASITLTVQDTQSTPRNLLYQVNIDPNQPVSLQFAPPELLKGGLQWQASATGLEGTIRGRTHLGLTLGTNNTPV